MMERTIMTILAKAVDRLATRKTPAYSTPRSHDYYSSELTDDDEINQISFFPF